MSAKPTVDAEALRALREYLEDDLNRFVFQTHFRASALLDESGLPRALIAMEMLQSAFSAFEAGRSHSELAEGYPVEAWRTDTVEVPRAWLRVLVEGWEKYKCSPPGTTLGEVLGLEGGGQGKEPARNKLGDFNRRCRLSNATLVEYLSERSEGGRGSWENACATVAEAEGVHHDTVKRASQVMRKRTLSDLSNAGALRGKTSRSAARAPDD